jgi:hypothetical protein
MNHDSTHEIQIVPADEMPAGAFEEEFETLGDYHRKAAHHFSEAAKHHLAAADADDEGEEELLDLHAFKAYRHQLNGVQCAEIAVMESEGDASDFEEAEEASAGQSSAGA